MLFRTEDSLLSPKMWSLKLKDGFKCCYWSTFAQNVIFDLKMKTVKFSTNNWLYIRGRILSNLTNISNPTKFDIRIWYSRCRNSNEFVRPYFRHKFFHNSFPSVTCRDVIYGRSLLQAIPGLSLLLKQHQKHIQNFSAFPILNLEFFVSLDGSFQTLSHFWLASCPRPGELFLFPDAPASTPWSSTPRPAMLIPDSCRESSRICRSPNRCQIHRHNKKELF